MSRVQSLKLALCSLLLALSLPLAAMDLQQAMNRLGPAKAAGLIGEQPNGYLGAVVAGSEAAAIVQQINAARKAEYQRLSQENGLPLADVEAMAGQKAIERTRSGHYIQHGGQWLRKP